MKTKRANLHAALQRAARPRRASVWSRRLRTLAMAMMLALAPIITVGQSSSSNTLVFGGLVNTSLGGATLSLTGGGELLVSGIGGSGEDGVEITTGTAAGFNASMLGVNFGAVNALITMNASGTLTGGGDKTDLGNATFRNIGNNTVQITTDFTTINATITKVEVNNGGILVLSKNVPTGVIGTFPATSRVNGCGKVTIRPPIRTSCYVGTIDPPALFSIGSDGTSAMGDEINLLADNPTNGIDHISEFRIKAANVGVVTITAESIVSPTQGVGASVSSFATRVAAVPNVAGDATSIDYTIEKGDHVLIEVYDALGRLISTFDEGAREAGSYSAYYTTRNLAPGTYYLKLQAGNRSAVSRMMVVH